MKISIETLKNRLSKEYEKKKKIETNIQKLEEQIEQIELCTLKNTMTEYKVDFLEVNNLIKTTLKKVDDNEKEEVQS